MAIGDSENKLYKALFDKDEKQVLWLCEKLPEEKGPLHVITIHKDSVLHVALYTEQVELVDKLMAKLPTDHSLMMHQSAAGNTVLHEAATRDKFHSVAKKMLKIQPHLLTAQNTDKETPLFSAARYGQMKMFKLLDGELQRNLGVEPAKEFHKKDDGSTILHAAIDAEHLELAILIARKHEYLHDKKNHEKLTALQLLACNPLAFQFRGKGLLKRFIDSRIKCNNDDEDRSCLQEGRVTSGYCVPRWDEMVRKRKRYNEAVKLAKLLIEKDTSWKVTAPCVGKEDAQKSDDEEDANVNNKTEAELKKIEVKLLTKIEAHLKKTDNHHELKKIERKKKKAERQQIPLLLATQTGCLEIVEEILRLHPQAGEQIDKDGRCILHTAIKYRQMKIFDRVEEKIFLMRRLIQNRDLKGNSILHMVGKKIRNEDVEHTAQHSPCLQLQDDLILFERIKGVIPPSFHKHTNKDGLTAEELLALNKEVLREKSQEWLKRMAESFSINAVLIATVAFTAAYTVPGGSNPAGSPVLNQTFFGIFTIGDVLSLTFCLTAVVIFLSMLTSSFHLLEFKYALPLKLMLGITFQLFSVTMIMLAFSATVILMIRNNEQWKRIVFYTLALLPVTILATCYMPLFMNLVYTLKYTLKEIRYYFPWSYEIEADHDVPKIEADHDVPVGYTTTSSPTAENSHSLV